MSSGSPKGRGQGWAAPRNTLLETYAEDGGKTAQARCRRLLGADAAVDGKHGDIEAAIRSFAPDGLDAALVTVNGRGLDQALQALKDGGRVAYPNGVEPEPQARLGIDVKGYDFNPDAAAFQKLNQLIEAGPFRVHIADRFSLEQAAAAQRALDDHHLGKIVLKAAS